MDNENESFIHFSFTSTIFEFLKFCFCLNVFSTLETFYQVMSQNNFFGKKKSKIIHVSK